MWKCQIHQPRYLVDFHPCISTPRSRYIFQIANNIMYSLIFNIASYGQLHTLQSQRLSRKLTLITMKKRSISSKTEF